MMYQNIASANSLLSKFNTYTQNNPNNIPFKNNQLLTENIHVMNNLNEMMMEKKIRKQKDVSRPSSNQKIIPNKISMSKEKKSDNNDSGVHAKKPSCNNIIEELLQPEKIEKGGGRIKNAFETEKNERNKEILPTNKGYKIIIKDKFVEKNYKDDKELIIHKISDQDKNAENFEKDVIKKKSEIEKINDEINIDYAEENMDFHKKKYEYKDSLIKQLDVESKNFSNHKDDYIEFYRKKQREAERDNKLCESIFSKLLDTGIIKHDELPADLLNDLKSNADSEIKNEFQKNN